MPASKSKRSLSPANPGLEGAPPAFSHRFLSFHIVHFTGNIAAERREERSMLTIRQACPEDAPQLSAMGYASYHHHFAHLWRDADELALFLKQEYAEDALRRSLADATQHWLIAEAPLLLVSLNIAISSEWLTTARLVRCCISST